MGDSGVNQRKRHSYERDQGQNFVKHRRLRKLGFSYRSPVNLPELYRKKTKLQEESPVKTQEALQNWAFTAILGMSLR